MTEDNPYQPPVENLPESLRAQLEAADFQDRLRKTSAVPDAEFWGGVAIGVVALLLANVLFNRFALVLLFAWLGGTIRVCMIYSARRPRRFATAECQLAAGHFRRCLLYTANSGCTNRIRSCDTVWMASVCAWVVPVFTSTIVLYVLLFSWSIRWAKQA